MSAPPASTRTVWTPCSSASASSARRRSTRSSPATIAETPSALSSSRCVAGVCSEQRRSTSRQYGWSRSWPGPGSRPRESTTASSGASGAAPSPAPDPLRGSSATGSAASPSSGMPASSVSLPASVQSSCQVPASV